MPKERKLITTSGELFEAVQSQRIFKDSKTFVDASPRYPEEEIMEKYHKLGDGDLAEFIQENFIFKKKQELSIGRRSLAQYVEDLWPKLLRKGKPGKRAVDSAIPLPHDYIVPGGRFNEIYYWDSYFTALGLAEKGGFQLIENMLDNFVFLQQEDGHIPNGSRTYYLSRSQPPVMSLMVDLLFQHGGIAAIEKYIPALQREWMYWTTGDRVGMEHDGVVLSRYYDEKDTPREESHFEDKEVAKGLSTVEAKKLYRNMRSAAASGWDFSSRWMKNHKLASREERLRTLQTTDILPVDLNALLYALEKTLSRFYQELGNEAEAANFMGYAERRKQVMQKLFWDDKTGFFHDFNCEEKKKTPIMSLAAIVPLYVELATQDQAKQVAYQLEILNSGLGLSATTENTGEQWDSPWGWAPLQVFAAGGLSKYGFVDDALKYMQNWNQYAEKVFSQYKLALEKYPLDEKTLAEVMKSPSEHEGGGEYPIQFGFGWTNGVYLYFNERIRELTVKAEQASAEVLSQAAQYAQFSLLGDRGTLPAQQATDVVPQKSTFG